MMGKVVIGKSFGGCVRYVVGKLHAEVLLAEGVRMENPAEITLDFDAQRKMNPELSKAVGHISLNWSTKDETKLDKSKMLEMAMEYLKLMGIKNTQFLVVRHRDSNHPHLHIIYNRVDNDGRTISDQFQLRKNVAACQSLTLKHGLYIAGDKKNVNRKALKGADKIRYQLFDLIKAAQNNSKNWRTFESQLVRSGIEIIPKYKSNSNEIQGISFKMDGLTFKASALDRSLSFGRLEAYFQTQGFGRESDNVGTIDQTEFFLDSSGSIASGLAHNVADLLEVFAGPTFFPNQSEPDPYLRKKKKRGIGEDEGQSPGRGR